MLLRVRTFLCIATTLLLIGCSGVPIRSDITVKELANKSIAVLSVTDDIQAGEHTYTYFYLNPDWYSQRVTFGSVKNDLLLQPSDFKDRRGHVYIQELEPGTHEFNGWQVVRTARIFPNPMPPPMRFQIRKGEVLYLGNLHARIILSEDSHGRKVLQKIIPTVEDRRLVDIAIAEALAPALKGQIRVELLPLGPWTHDGGNSKMGQHRN
ncbi:MAG: hypothetical protein ABIK82_04420 [Pseudomonadota bacterium]